MARMAGPILRGGEMATCIIDAIQEDNTDRRITIGDHNGYVRVEGEEGLILRRSTLESVLGRPFRMPEMEIVMTGFSGKIEMDADMVRWYFKTVSETPTAVEDASP